MTATVDTTLTLKWIFQASPDTVFKAWTNPDQLKQWASPPKYTIPEAQVDLKVGGAYRITMKSPDGSQHSAVGTYKEVQAPNKLVYTWSWEGEHVLETLVTVTFQPVGDTTEVLLKHENFPNSEEREKHQAGWAGCASKLVTLLLTS